MAEISDPLMQELQRRVQANFEAQQGSPIMQALGKLSGSLQTLELQQKTQEQEQRERESKELEKRLKQQTVVKTDLDLQRAQQEFMSKTKEQARLDAPPTPEEAA